MAHNLVCTIHEVKSKFFVHNCKVWFAVVLTPLVKRLLLRTSSSYADDVHIYPPLDPLTHKPHNCCPSPHGNEPLNEQKPQNFTSNISVAMMHPATRGQWQKLCTGAYRYLLTGLRSQWVEDKFSIQGCAADGFFPKHPTLSLEWLMAEWWMAERCDVTA